MFWHNSRFSGAVWGVIFAITAPVLFHEVNVWAPIKPLEEKYSHVTERGFNPLFEVETLYNNQLKAIYTKGWFYILAVTIRRIEKAGYQKSYPDRWRGDIMQVRHQPPSHLPHVISDILFGEQFSLTLFLCFICTVWGSDKSQMFNIQEEHSIPVIFFHLFSQAWEIMVFKCSSLVEQMSCLFCVWAKSQSQNLQISNTSY